MYIMILKMFIIKKITHVHRKLVCMATHPKVDSVISRFSILGNLYLILPFKATQNKQISYILRENYVGKF